MSETSATDHRTTVSARSRANRLLALRLSLIVLASSLFAIALVPLYDVFCDITGFNGQQDRRGGFDLGGLGVSQAQASQGALPASMRVDTSRQFAVGFLAQVMPGVPLDVRPLDVSLDVHPGDLRLTRYLVRNTSQKPLHLQAVPTVSPSQASLNFHKIECFCFKQQKLAPGESREMPLTFVLKPEMTDDIRDITLSYAFYRVPENLVAQP